MGIASEYRGPSGKTLPGAGIGKEEVKKRLEGLFREKGVLLAYLFGSMARGEASSLSDIDIAVLLPDATSFPLQELLGDIWKALGTERFDLVVLNGASPSFAFEVVAEGELIYARDEETLNAFEMKVIREFQDTAYLRRVQNEYLRERAKAWSSERKVSLSG